MLRVVVRKDSESPRYISSYDLSLEADDAGVMRYFEVEVSVNSSNDMWLEECYLLVDNQKPIRLYHYLGLLCLLDYASKLVLFITINPKMCELMLHIDE